MKIRVRYTNGMEISMLFPPQQQTLEDALKVVKAIQKEFATTPLHSLYVEFDNQEVGPTPTSGAEVAVPLQQSASRSSGKAPSEDIQEDINKLMNVLATTDVSTRTKWMLLELFRKTGRSKFTVSVHKLRDLFGVGSTNTILRFYDELKNIPGITITKTSRGTIIDLSHILSSSQ